MGYYVVNNVFDAYKLQEDTSCNGEISTASEIFFRVQYLRGMKENKKWH